MHDNTKTNSENPNHFSFIYMKLVKFVKKFRAKDFKSIAVGNTTSVLSLKFGNEMVRVLTELTN